MTMQYSLHFTPAAVRYSLHFTDTTVTIRKGLIGRRSTTNSSLIGAYASLYALHGAAALPRIWRDMLSIPAKQTPMPAQNASSAHMLAYPPTGCASARIDAGPTMQPRDQFLHLDTLRAHGVETAYQSSNYHLK